MLFRENCACVIHIVQHRFSAGNFLRKLDDFPLVKHSSKNRRPKRTFDHLLRILSEAYAYTRSQSNELMYLFQPSLPFIRVWPPSAIEPIVIILIRLRPSVPSWSSSSSPVFACNVKRYLARLSAASPPPAVHEWPNSVNSSPSKLSISRQRARWL